MFKIHRYLLKAFDDISRNFTRHFIVDFLTIPLLPVMRKIFTVVNHLKVILCQGDTPWSNAVNPVIQSTVVVHLINKI